jgi:regulator of cell morphogenesis and NO signaling
MTPSAEIRLGDLVAAVPAAGRVLRRFGVDYVGHGSEHVGSACRLLGVDVQLVMKSIANEPPEATDTVWLTKPLGALIDHLLHHYHAQARVDLPELAKLSQKVALAADDPRLTEVAIICERLLSEGLSHLDREEAVVFPWIRSTRPTGPDSPVWELREEHDHHQEHLKRLRVLTGGYTLPANASDDQRRLYAKLQATETDLLDHMHLENNVLFPRALQEATDLGERL